MTNKTKFTKTEQRAQLARYITVTLLAATAFTIATPFALLAIGNLTLNSWAQPSNEGQAYGGIAAVFGILALAGVAVSIILQSREAAASRAQSLRDSHSGLFFKALDDPELLACWGPSPQGNFRQDRQYAYTNLIISFWYSLFEIGNLTDDQLRHVSSEIFKTASGRQ